MRTRRTTVLVIVAGCVICIAGAAAWVFLSLFESEPSDAANASRQIEQVRKQFSGAAPLIDITSTLPGMTGVQWSGELTRTIPQEAGHATLRRVRVLTWRPRDSRLSRITIPWWLVRMRDESLDLTEQVGTTTGRSITLRVEDLERLGPALLVDHVERDGARFVIWTE